MASRTGNRVFDFFPLEDRILLSADAMDVEPACPDAAADLMLCLADQIAVAPSGCEVLPQGEQQNQEQNNDHLQDQPSEEETPQQQPDAPIVSCGDQQTLQRVEVIFIDESVENADELISEIENRSETQTSWIIQKLNAEEDGITQVRSALESIGQVNSVHLISHGDGEGIRLGATWLTEASLDQQVGELAAWGVHLSADADLLVYGCDLASTAEGISLIESLAMICDCDVAASDDLTGHEALKGDWTLEHQVGSIESQSIGETSNLSRWFGTLNTTSDLEAHYSFDTFSGSVIVDASGNGNSASRSDGGLNTGGIVGTGAIDFALDEDRFSTVLLPDTSTLNPGIDDFSIAYWFQPASDDEEGTIYSDADANGVIRFQNLETGELAAEIRGTNGAFTITSAALARDQWHHVGLTRQGDSFSLYLNGRLTETHVQDVGSISNSSGAFLGAQSPAAGDFDGKLDDLRLYSRRLDANDIEDLYLQASPSVHVQTLPDSPVIDGSEDDSWLLAPSNRIDRVLSGVGDENDLAGQFKVSSSDEGLHFLITVQDDHWFGDSGIDLTLDDSVEVFIDGNGNGGTNYDAHDYHLVFRLTDGAVATGLNSSTDLSGLTHTVAGSGDERILELSLSWDALGGVPGDGTPIGIDFQINDDDGSGRETLLAWNDITDSAQSDPSKMGEAIVGASTSGLVAAQSIDGGLLINQVGNNTYYRSETGLDSNLDEFTYEVRFSADAYAGEHVFLSYNVGDEDHLSFQISNFRNRLELDIGAGRQLYSDAIDYKAALTDGDIHTLSVTWENTEGDWQVFIDGILIDHGTGFQTGNDVAAGGTFVFGQEQDTQDGRYNANQHFRGTLYEARLYDDVRTTAEIASNYAKTAETTDAHLIANWDFGSIEIDGSINDSIGGNSLTRQSVSGTGFVEDDVQLEYSVDEDADNGTLVGRLDANDLDRLKALNDLLDADPDLAYSSVTGKFYKLIDSAETWGDASSDATANTLSGISGDLVSIRSQTENLILQNLANQAGRDVWIAGTDRASEGDFRWTQQGLEADLFWSGGLAGDSSADAYSNFRDGAPEGSGPGDDFLQLRASDGKWDDFNATDQVAYVIQWDADEVLDQTAPITYTLLSQSESGAFSLDPDTGRISVAEGTRLDFSTLDTHSLQVRISDAFGGSYDETLEISLNEANEAPMLDVSGTVNLNEGSTVTITTSELSASDPDQTADQLRYVLTTEPVQGFIQLNGTSLIAGESFTQQDILDGAVTYVHGGAHVSSDAIDFVVDDGSGDVTVGSLSFAVTLLDDPVTITAPDQIDLNEDEVARFGPGGIASISISDEEGQPVTVRLTASSGRLDFAIPPGLTVIDGDGSDGTLEFTGNSAQISAALDSLELSTDPGFNGTVSLDIAASDSGATTNDRINVVFAAVPTVMIWDGGGTTDDWSDPLNWDIDRVPRADDIVIFNATSSSNSIVDSSFSGTVSTVQISASYTGTLSQEIDLNVIDTFSMTGGAYVIGGMTLDVDGDWTVTGGSINATGSQIEVGGNLLQTATLISTDSTVVLDGAGDQTWNSNQSFNDADFRTAGSLTLQSDIVINGDLTTTTSINSAGRSIHISGSDDHVIDSGNNGLGNLRIDTSGLVQLSGNTRVTGDLLLINATTINGGDLIASGDVLITDDAWSGTSGIELSGSADQLLSAGGGTGAITALTINKSGGVATLSDSFGVSGDVDVIDGIVDATAWDLKLTSGLAATIDGNIGTISSLDIDASSLKTIDGILSVAGLTQFTQVALLNGGTISARGNVNALENTYSGTTVLELGGSSNQQVTTNGGSGMIRNLQINKSGGTAVALDDLELAGNIRHLSGTLDTFGVTTRFISIALNIDTGSHAFGDVEFAGFVAATINGNLIVDGDLDFSQVFFVDGGEIVVTGDVHSSDGTVLGTAGIRFNGTGDQTVTGADLTDGTITVDKTSGRVLIADDLNLNGSSQDVVISRGELSLDGHKIKTSGVVSIDSGQLSGPGTIEGDLSVLAGGTVSLDGFNASPEANDQLVVTGQLTTASGSTLRLDITGISSGGLIDNLITYGSRTGSIESFQLIGNSGGYIAHSVYDDTAGSFGVFLNTAPSGNFTDVTVLEDSPNTVVDLYANLNDLEHGRGSFTFSLLGNDNPALFDQVSIDNSSGTLTLDYAPDANGVANLTIRVADPYGDFIDLPLVVTVIPQDDIPILSGGNVALDEGGTVTLTTSNLNATDIDTSDDQLRFTITRSPAIGVIRVDGIIGLSFTQQQLEEGRVTYTHDGSEQFSDSFNIVVSDGTTTVPQELVSITIRPVNDQDPVIISDGGGDDASVSIDENSTIVTQVVANDDDLPGTSLTYSIVGGADSGLFQIDAGTGRLAFRIAPDAEALNDTNGDGTFEVQVSVSDGARTDTQSIMVRVNDVNEFDVSPVSDLDGRDDQVSIFAVPGTEVGITVNAIDQDATGSGVTYQLVDNDGGRFTIDSNSGVIRTAAGFDPDTDGPTRSITVRAISQDGSFSERDFTIRLTNSNTNPIANDDSYTTLAGNILRSGSPGLLGNDFDADGDSLRSILVQQANHGRVRLNPDGSFRYIPNAGYVGQDQFQYLVFDGTGNSNIATVSLDVLVGGGITTTGGSGTGGGRPPVPPDPQPDSDGNPGSHDPDGRTPSDPVQPPGLPGGQSDERTDNDSSGDSEGSNQRRPIGRQISKGGDGDSGSSTGVFAPTTSTQESVTQVTAALVGNGAGGALNSGDDAMLQAVFQNLFLATEDGSEESPSSSQEMRQLQRILEMDLKQAIVWDMWDDQESMLDESPIAMIIGTAGAAVGLFSIGYVMWALRGGAFISVMASCIPSWRMIDPTGLLTAYHSTRGNIGEDLDDLLR